MTCRPIPFAGLSARCRGASATATVATRASTVNLTSPIPRSRLPSNNGYQFQQDRYFHCAIFILFPKSTPAPTRHGPRTRRQALQNLYFLPQLEAPHWHDRQYDHDHAREQEQQGPQQLCSARYRLFHRGSRRAGRVRVHNGERSRRRTARGALSAGRRVTRPRDLDIPPHHRRILPRNPFIDSTSPHATAPPRPTSTLPMLPLRGRPRHAHAASAT